MTALKVGSRDLGRRYQEKAEELLEIAQGLSCRPSPEEVHDLRVTARRIQVMRRLLPRRVRMSQASKRFDLLLKSVLKRTSQLRDLDTLTSTLEGHRTSLPGDLLVKLRNQRSDAAAQGKGACDLLAEAPPPDVELSDIKGKGLSRRLRKRVKKHGRAARELLSQVLQDESKVKELHSLRIEVKKLRYLLELSGKTPPELAVVTRWQDSLGAIHDLDVAMEFIQTSEIDMKVRAIDELRRARHRGYLGFVGECRIDSMGALEDSAVIAGGPVPQPV